MHSFWNFDDPITGFGETTMSILFDSYSNDLLTALIVILSVQLITKEIIIFVTGNQIRLTVDAKIIAH